MKIHLHKNYILDDPLLDYMNINYKNLGYKRDYEYKSFNKNLQLSSYIENNKKIFIDLIKQRIGKEFREYETSVGKVDVILRTDLLHKYFKNGSSFVGKNFSIMTIEYSNLNIDKKMRLCEYPLQQKYYKYKNWVLKQECSESGIKIDYSFIIGRRYGDIESYDTLFENTTDYSDLQKKIELHFNFLEQGNYILGKNIFPNMKNKNDFPWTKAKKKIAERLKEITLLKGMSSKKRNEYIKNELYDYSVLGLEYVENKIPIKYDKSISIPKCENSFYIDFEILTSVYDDFSLFPKANKETILFNIGCGYEKRKNFCFRSYIAYKLEDEGKILKEFIDYINSMEGKECVFFHWTHIEKSIFYKKIECYSLDVNKHIRWFDLHKFFSDNSILVEGCYTYKLKDVAKNLYKNSVIKSKWSGTLSDGLSAMTGYIKHLSEDDKDLIKHITYYNMIDCKVLWEIRNIFL